MIHKLNLIIFDLDGTLVDAYPAIIESFNYTMKKLGLPAQGDLTIRRAVGWGRTSLLEPFVDRKDLKKAVSFFSEHHRKALKRNTRFLPGAKQILAYLKKKRYKLAVASNRPRESAFVIFHHLKMIDYFDFILCGDEVKRPKPCGDMLRRILQEFSLKASQALYVGDMTVDVLTGYRAKVRTVAVVTGSSTAMEIAELRPFKMIKRLSQLREVVLH